MVFAGVMETDPRCLVVTAMRNEGAFIVEWVAWYRMLGFDILVATNNCTDRSPALLDALADAGWLTHVRHHPPKGVPPQKAAYRVLRRQPQVAESDWVLTCDVDEFLVIHVSDTIQEYLGPPPWDSLGIAFSWRTFGTGGRALYAPGLVHRQFTGVGRAKVAANKSFKSMFQRPLDFGRFDAHTPVDFAGDWAAPENGWINGGGDPLPAFADAAAHPIRFLETQQINHMAAQMNHYVLRSVEEFDAKRGTLSASSFADRYDDTFFARRDQNDQSDTSALRFAPAFDTVYARAMALPGVARLHHLCCANRIARLCRAQGLAAADDPRWQTAMAAAG